MPALNVLDSSQQHADVDRPAHPHVTTIRYNQYPHLPVLRGQRSPSDPNFNHAIYESNSYSILPHNPPSGYFDRVYHYPIRVEGAMSPSPMSGHLSVSPGSGSWPAHVLTMQPNPYPPFPLPPPPPQVLHKVWILDCNYIATGCQAVLLLRPNVSLFSTDALPVNCSAYSTNPDVFRSPPYRPSVSPLTCECLTQTLCCHTCGASVGYTIVVPCSRCTSSTSTNNRATNGHRFVFHAGEVTATARHHIPNEPGVIPVEYPPSPLSPPPPLASAHSMLVYNNPDAAIGHQRMGPSFTRASHHRTSSSPSSGLLPTSDEVSALSASMTDTRSPPHARPPFLQSPSAHQVSRLGGGDLATEARAAPIEHAVPLIRKLRAGDMLYWHQLSKAGEIPGVEEDLRARIPNWSRSFDR
ncbi:hypothetical protein ID866_523 [Astraeus odoratus]|nr:hypothetical protein ID866_523 [Astraeus odoratus]